MSETVENYNDDVDINNPEFDGGSKSKVKAISDAGQALAIAQKLECNDRERDIRRARVLSAFNGAAPYCEKELINKAQAYRYNVSFGFMEGVIGRAVVPYNELTIDIGNLTQIEADLPDEKLKDVQVEFSDVMKKWGGWPKFISRLNQDLVLNGYNNAIWPSDYDPFPIFVAQKEGFVDDGSPNSVNDLEVFVWRKEYLIHELYAKIEDADVAKKAGWNTKNVRRALENAAPENLWTNNQSQSGSWVKLEEAIRGGSLFTSIVGAKKVNTFHVFASELDGSVTHYIVLDTGTNPDSSLVFDRASSPELFKKEKRFDSMRDFIVYFDLETGDGTWHGSRGLGQRAFNTHRAIDKLRNSLLDQAFVSGLTLLQPGDQTSQEDFTLSVVGPFAVIPQGIQINPAVLPSISNSTFQVDALLIATAEQRIGDVIPESPSSTTGVSKTATEAKITAGRQALITRGNLKRYVDPVSEAVSIIVRRLLKKNSPNAYAKDFQRNLKKKGLTDDDLSKIRGARNTGRIEDILGNTAQNTQVIFSEFRGDPSVDQYQLSHRRISSVLDADAADELLITDKDQTMEIESSRTQEFEITTMQNGMNVPVSPRDDHEAHLKVVLEWVGANIQNQAQQMNPEMIPVLKVVIAHGAQHLGFLGKQKGKKAVYDDLHDRLNLAVNTVKKLEKDALKLSQEAIKGAAALAKTPEEQAQVQQAQAQLGQVPNE